MVPVGHAESALMIYRYSVSTSIARAAVPRNGLFLYILRKQTDQGDTRT